MKKLTIQEMNRLSSEEFKLASKTDITIVLENVRSMMNVGSVFRTADAFRIAKICLCGITATPPHREIHKTALGATETVQWEYHPEAAPLLLDLKNKGSLVIAIEQLHGAVILDQWIVPVNRHLVFVLGNEVSGVSDDALAQCHHGIEIPQLGTKHSLNIAVSAGIVMWEAFRQINAFVPGL